MNNVLNINIKITVIFMHYLLAAKYLLHQITYNMILTAYSDRKISDIKQNTKTLNMINNCRFQWIINSNGFAHAPDL